MLRRVFTESLVVALLFFPSLVLAQSTAEEVASKIAKIGALFSTDREGRIRDVIFATRRMSFADGDIESIDFSALSALKSVIISSPRVTDRSIVHLQKLPAGLTSLRIFGAQVTDPELAILLQKHKSTLFSLHLFETAITDRLLSDIGKLDKLFSLSLHGTKITDQGLKHLVALERLQVLNLTRTDITDAGLTEIGQFPSLSALVLEHTKVTDAGLQQLGALQTLESLYVTSTNVTEEGKNTLRLALPHVKFEVAE